MCDYSLHAVAFRQATRGDKLERFPLELNRDSQGG
jgi:hypothetical protein